MGFGSEDLHKINKGIIFLRVSGYGQKGKMAHKPGHDINYLSIGGIILQLN
jgi:alpha-methylacyl-CoA racemase